MAKKKAVRRKMAACCECGEDYPDKDLQERGEIYCPACRIVKPPEPSQPPAGIRNAEPGPVTFGGSLVREMGSFPGLLAKFVTVSRKYARGHFLVNQDTMAGAFSHTNNTPIVDDFGKEWAVGSLLHLGSDGRDEAENVYLVHKFIPITALYSPADFAFLSGGERF